jgi:hypothetical protein
MYIFSKSTGLVYRVNNTVPDVDRLTLNVDRATGDMSITNASGGDVEITGLSLTSPSGSIAAMFYPTGNAAAEPANDRSADGIRGQHILGAEITAIEGGLADHHRASGDRAEDGADWS